MIGSFITNVGYTVIMFSNDLSVRIAAFGVMGIGMMTKNAYCYSWIGDSVHKEYKITVSTIITCVDAVPMAVFCLYIAFINKDWL